MIMLHIFFVKKHLHRYKWFLQLVALLLKNLSHNTNVPYVNMGFQISKIGIIGKKSTLSKKFILFCEQVYVNRSGFSQNEALLYLIYLILYPSPGNLTTNANKYKYPRIPTLKHGKARFKHKSYSIFSHTDIHTYHTFTK